MHTCLTLSNIGGQWYVEREISGLISALESCCDSVRSCDIAVEGPSGEGAARCWRVDLKLRVFDDVVRATARAPAGADPQESLQRVLADICARAGIQLDHIGKKHRSDCPCGERNLTEHFEACA